MINYSQLLNLTDAIEYLIIMFIKNPGEKILARRLRWFPQI